MSFASSPNGSVCRAPGCSATKLCDAHIVPRGFARSLSEPGGHNRAIRSSGSKPSKQPLGEFDPAILCAACDEKLGRLDEYAITLCSSLPAATSRGNIGMLRHAPFDGAQFARAMLAILWRASISRRDQFAGIDLGPYEARAAAILLEEAPLSSMPEYAVMLSRYASPDHDARKFIFMPLRIRSGAVNAYTIGLGGFLVWAKFDKRPIDRQFLPFVINDATALIAPLIPFERTAEYAYFLQAGHGDRRRRAPARAA